MTREANDHLQERVVIPYAHGSLSATYTAKVLRPKYRMRVSAVEYVNETGLAADPTNYFSLVAKNGATDVAAWSTLDTAEGAIPASDFITWVAATDPEDMLLAPTDVLTFSATLSGVATLPPGHIIVHGIYL